MVLRVSFTGTGIFGRTRWQGKMRLEAEETTSCLVVVAIKPVTNKQRRCENSTSLDSRPRKKTKAIQSDSDSSGRISPTYISPTCISFVELYTVGILIDVCMYVCMRTGKARTQ